MAPVTFQSGLPMLKSLDMGNLLNASSVCWDETMIFFEQMYIPTHASTCATLKQLRHSHLGQVLLLSVRYEMSNSSYVAVQSMVKDKAGWYKDEPWEIVLRGMISWYFFYLFILFRWQDMFLVINRRGNLVEEHAETHVKICQDMSSCSNVCWLWATLPAVCHHSVSAWSFWHFGSCCYNLVLRRVSKVVALPDRLLQYSCSCYQLQAREIGIFEILRISEFYRNCYRDSAAYCGDRCRNLLGVRARVQSSRTSDH